MAPPPHPQLDKDRHIKYWKRCAQLLPEPYTAGESSRMSFGFFIVAALDLLGALESVVTVEERQSWIEWIYACQVPHTGGFRGFTGTALAGLRSPHNWHWDPANLPNTYFALATLLILGDDLARVRRQECLAWVRQLQHPDGSFGEFLGEDDEVQGGSDPRLCMCAAGTIRILMGKEEQGSSDKIDQVRLQQYLTNCQSQEGGIAQAPLLEAHSGLNYCAIATLSFLSQSHNEPVSIQELAGHTGLDIANCVRWMLERQTTWIEDDDDDDDEEEQDETDVPVLEDQSTKDPSSNGALQELDAIAGFCGRCGKIADTCYCFWNVGALTILENQHLVDIEAVRKYLLQTVTHIIGGFGKGPGELPDLLHSYLGLAVLAIYKEPGLKEFDATFCFSADAVQNVKRVAWMH